MVHEAFEREDPITVRALLFEEEHLPALFANLAFASARVLRAA